MTATPTDPHQFGPSPVVMDGDKSALLRPRVMSPGRRVWYWPGVWLLLLAASSALGLWAISLITRIPPLPNCEEISAFSADSERLYCAKQAAVSGTERDLVAGVVLISAWPEIHPLYEDSQGSLDRWSRGVFKLAQQRMQKGDLTQSIQLVEHIPPRAEIHGESAAAVERWQQEWTLGEEIATGVTEAVGNENWSGARKQLLEMKRLTSDYWLKERYQFLGQYIQSEENARRTLNQAKTLASSSNLDDLATALSLVRQINVKDNVWAEAKPLVTGWAERLLNYGFQKWEQEDLEGAIALIQQVPVDLAVEPEAKDLVQFAHAQRLATFNPGWEPTYGAMLNLTEAIQAVQRIESDSLFYPEAQAKLTLWGNQLSDLQRLYGATLLANLRQKSSLKSAIAQAQEITQDRPQRQQAQTLISHWSNEIERIEDRPFLSRAEQLADQGDKASLELAIAEAKKVAQGRALRIEAQTLVAQWTKQIQVLEDQPLYSKALELASKGKLRDAITEARKIERGRALYSQAQSSISEWTNRIQVAEDRPILVEAEELAYEGRLSDAISVAAQIGPGRALYREARNSIAIWDAERAYIRSTRAPVDDYDEDDGYDDESE